MMEEHKTIKRIDTMPLLPEEMGMKQHEEVEQQLEQVREKMKGKYQAVWRVPAVQTDGFPKLMVHDNYQTGSVNVRNTRLPLWAIITTVVCEGWDRVESGWSPEEHYGYTKTDLAHFLYCLLEQRGEFGRLLLVLANAEHRNDSGWWEEPKYRRMVIKQLQRCLDTLNGLELELF